MVKSRCRLLTDGMGLGKTVETIVSLPSPLKTGILVVCPASVKWGWLAEIKKWWGDDHPEGKWGTYLVRKRGRDRREIDPHNRAAAKRFREP